jgi:hypothetical protein
MLCACQPTPENPVVIGKNQESMLEKAAATPSGAQVIPLPQQVDAPGTYTADIRLADGKLMIMADAPVTIPGVQGMPTLKVKAADFTQQQIDGVIAALLGEQKLYTVSGEMTKDEISDSIVRMQEMKTTEDFSSEEDQKMLDEEIARLEKQFDTAPEERTITESTGQLEQMEIKDENGAHEAYYMGTNVTTNPSGKGPYATFWVQNNNDMKEAKFEVDENGGVGGRPLRRNAMLMYRYEADPDEISNYGQNTPMPVDETTVIDDPEVLKLLNMTPAEAKAQVESLLEKAGLDYIKICAMYLVDDANLGDFDGLVGPAKHCAYRICLCRMVNDAPCAYLRGSSSVGNIDEVMKEIDEKGTAADTSGLKYVGDWEYESFEILINDDGVLTFEWWSPLDITETVVENSALMPFERIREIFEQRLRDTYEPRAKEDYVVDMTINVTRVSLELQRIAEQDSIENGLLVPAWNFYGTMFERNKGEGDEIYENKNGFDVPQPLLTVNAVDGSVIDTGMGY